MSSKGSESTRRQGDHRRRTRFGSADGELRAEVSHHSRISRGVCIWCARVDESGLTLSDYLLYSRLHLPSLHLSGLATTRLTPTLQAHLAFLSQPAPPSTTSSPSGSYTHSRAPSETSVPSPTAPSTPGNILLSLQHDTGRYSGEYTYSAQDGMFGWRGLPTLVGRTPPPRQRRRFSGKGRLVRDQGYWLAKAMDRKGRGSMRRR
jgi:hypothetical protein